MARLSSVKCYIQLHFIAKYKWKIHSWDNQFFLFYLSYLRCYVMSYSVCLNFSESARRTRSCTFGNKVYWCFKRSMRLDKFYITVQSQLTSIVAIRTRSPLIRAEQKFYRSTQLCVSDDPHSLNHILFLKKITKAQSY